MLSTNTIIPFIVQPYAACCDTIKEPTEGHNEVIARGLEMCDLKQNAQLFSSWESKECIYNAQQKKYVSNTTLG